jgi:hypothetical protein
MQENRETSNAPAGDSGRTVGEGSGRNARVYASEESDSGIVPMNHSSKIEQSMAESEEGRPLIKENTRQSNTRPTQSGARVSLGLAGVRKSSKGTQGDEVHRSAPPCHDRCIKGQLWLFEAQSRSRSGWRDMAGV